MTDRVESMQLRVDEVMALRQQLAECEDLITEVPTIMRRLAESQALVKVLRGALGWYSKARVIDIHPDLTGCCDDGRFARKILALPSDLAIRQAEESTKQAMIADGWRQCAKGQGDTQYCGLTEEAIRQAKREKADSWISAHGFDKHVALWLLAGEQSAAMTKPSVRSNGSAYD
jgi:hypothetical protein